MYANLICPHFLASFIFFASSYAAGVSNGAPTRVKTLLVVFLFNSLSSLLFCLFMDCSALEMRESLSSLLSLVVVKDKGKGV